MVGKFLSRLRGFSHLSGRSSRLNLNERITIVGGVLHGTIRVLHGKIRSVSKILEPLLGGGLLRGEPLRGDDDALVDAQGHGQELELRGELGISLLCE